MSNQPFANFANRREAGKILADMLMPYANQDDLIVLALPRGGVPVAYEIAKTLHAPLDVFIVRKLGVPWHEELAMGAIATPHVVVFNESVINSVGVSQEDIDKVIQTESQELRRRNKVYRGGRPFPDLTHKTIVLVDDGIATGATMRAAIQALRQQNPTEIVVAVPVAALDTCEELSRTVDQFVCPLTPEDLHAIGAWYGDFSQTEDEEVRQLLSDTTHPM